MLDGDGLLENFPEGLVPRAVGACDWHVEEPCVPSRSEAKEDREVDTLEVVSDETQDIVAWRKVEDSLDGLLPAQSIRDLEIVSFLFGRALVLQGKPGRVAVNSHGHHGVVIFGEFERGELIAGANLGLRDPEYLLTGSHQRQANVIKLDRVEHIDLALLRTARGGKRYVALPGAFEDSGATRGDGIDCLDAGGGDVMFRGEAMGNQPAEPPVENFPVVLIPSEPDEFEKLRVCDEVGAENLPQEGIVMSLA